MKPLSTDARAVLDEVQRVERPSDEHRRRMKRRVAAAVAGSAVVSTAAGIASAEAAVTATGGAAGAAGATAVGASAVTKIVVAVAVVGTVGTAAIVVDEPGVVEHAPRVETTVPLVADEPQRKEVRAEPPTVPEPKPTVAPEPKRAGQPYRSEAALMQRAVRAAETGEHAAVLRYTTRHERRYPDSALAPERAALQIVALCRLDRASEAEPLKDRLRRSEPDSYLWRRIDEACH